MRESGGHLFPSHFFYSFGIMLVYSWQINTRPCEVAVPAERQTMKGTAMTFSTPHFAASYACKSHEPLILMVISHFVKRNALSRLWPPAWAHIPIWLGNTFLYYISSALCSVNSMPHCAVLLNLWCSTEDLSLSCFTVWPLPKPVTHNMKLCFIPHYELCEFIQFLPRAHPDITDFYSSSELMFRNIYFKLFALPRDSSVVFAQRASVSQR